MINHSVGAVFNRVMSCLMYYFTAKHENDTKTKQVPGTQTRHDTMCCTPKFFVYYSST